MILWLLASSSHNPPSTCASLTRRPFGHMYVCRIFVHGSTFIIICTFDLLKKIWQFWFGYLCRCLQKVILEDLKGSNKGIKKEFIHVRIDISGSPLECPGMIFSFYVTQMILELLNSNVYFLFCCLFVVLSVFCFEETFPRIGCVRVKHRGMLLTLKGTVIRSAAIKMYEGERWYMCLKCQHK